MLDAARALVGQRKAARLGADQARDGDDRIQDAAQGALVEDQHLQPLTDQLGREVGLDLGKADDQVRPQGGDLGQAAALEAADPGLVAHRFRGAPGVAADADDAVLLAQAVEDVGGLVGQADDASIGVARGHGRRGRVVQPRAAHARVSRPRCAAWTALRASAAST